MPRLPKKNVRFSSAFETLPHELATEILGRVAASSVTDMVNAKLSCKSLNEFSEDMHIYQRVSLDKFPVVPWNPLSETQQTFLNKCREHENPELIYREAVLDYFNKTNIRSTHKKLQRALKQGHLGALYVTCIVLLLSHDQESKRKGIKILANLKKYAPSRDKLKSSRKELIKILDKMWVKNPILIEPEICCTRRHELQRKSRWCEEEDVVDCEACAADLEISSICSKYNNY